MLPFRLLRLGVNGICFRRASSVCQEFRDVMGAAIVEEREKVIKFRKEYNSKEVGKVTVDQVYGGMKGIMGLICETSVLDSNEGIRFRGYSINEVMKILPKSPNGTQVQPEGIFWLLATGKVPNRAQVDSFSAELVDKCAVPDFIPAMLAAMPSSVHPMAQFSAAMTALSEQSEFAKAYINGIPKADHWKYVMEDAISVVAKAPTVAAMVYRNLYCGGSPATVSKEQRDWTCNFAEMLGFNGKDFVDMLRLYLTLHCDHEGGNVSAHACHLVGSALSDPFLCFGASMNGLAGPLHGMACQEVLTYLKKLREEMGEAKMTDKQLGDFIRATLARGQVIPGYGHAVLRKTDPRFTAFQEFAKANIKDDPLVELVAQLHRVVPGILAELGKVQNPFPNVDSHSGCLLQHFGMTENHYYTVLFGVSRSLGVMSQLIWSRALGFPIERPKSISTDGFISLLTK